LSSRIPDEDLVGKTGILKSVENVFQNAFIVGRVDTVNVEGKEILIYSDYLMPANLGFSWSEKRSNLRRI